MIEVRVPATSANVGPGFDCMGIALCLYAVFRFEESDSGLSISGCPKQWQNEDNLVYQACLRVFKKCNKEIKGLKITIDAGDIPEARGLGSSAVCIVAGVMGANALLHNPLSKRELLNIATEMEGHPDNVAPALYGGLSISFCEEQAVYTVTHQVDKGLLFCAMIPDYPVLTRDARRVLPKQVSFQDALYNIGRCAALAKGLSEGNREMIAHACDDRLHQPYRKALILHYDEVEQLCHQHHMLTCYISGSGSTMMAISDNREHAQALLNKVKQLHPTWQVHLLSVDNEGALFTEV